MAVGLLKIGVSGRIPQCELASCRNPTVALSWPLIARIHERRRTATYSIAEAKDQLSKLVRQAEEGEDVAITRHGKVVAHLRSIAERPRRQLSHELVPKIVERAKSRPSLGENAVDIIRRMRDGEWD
jgi:prevent-host-death family protein